MPQETNTAPTNDQIRSARHKGFSNSVTHMPEDARAKITGSFQTQDARREKNVSGFFETMREK